jgi:hydroxymethylglutaryl-CoA lyase
MAATPSPMMCPLGSCWLSLASKGGIPIFYPGEIHIREVSPRDGLQSEPTIVSTDDKVHLVELLVAANLKHINVTSFVSPKAVPQTADAAEVMARVPRVPGVKYDATVPNLVGANRAIDAGVDEVTVFVSASDGGSRSNVGRSTGEALAQALQVVRRAREVGIGVVATIANAFGSAYEGAIPDDRILDLARRFRDGGATHVALGDTSGEGTPRQVADLVIRFGQELPDITLSLHLHDTRGYALANVLAALDAGATHFDGAVGGIGGSPFTRNAAGNLPTEDLVHLCDECGIATGVNLAGLFAVYSFLAGILGHDLPGRLGAVGPTKTAQPA